MSKPKPFCWYRYVYVRRKLGNTIVTENWVERSHDQAGPWEKTNGPAVFNCNMGAGHLESFSCAGSDEHERVHAWFEREHPRLGTYYSRPIREDE